MNPAITTASLTGTRDYHGRAGTLAPRDLPGPLERCHAFADLHHIWLVEVRHIPGRPRWQGRGIEVGRPGRPGPVRSTRRASQFAPIGCEQEQVEPVTEVAREALEEHRDLLAPDALEGELVDVATRSTGARFQRNLDLSFVAGTRQPARPQRRGALQSESGLPCEGRRGIVG